MSSFIQFFNYCFATKEVIIILPIDGFENYQVTTDGQIWNGTKFLCIWIDNVGYYQTLLYKEGKRYYRRVHRLVAQAFIPNGDTNKNQVNHIDSNKTNNAVENLEWVTNSENTQHGYKNGAYKYKSRSHAIICTNKYTKEKSIFKSIRSAADSLDLNRKTITSILKLEKTIIMIIHFNMLKN